MFSKIYIKALISVFILISIYVVLIFSIVIPNIEKTTIKLEESIGEIQLQKTLQIVNSAATEMKAYKENSIYNHKNTLKKLSSTVWYILKIKELESRGKDKYTIKKRQKEAINLISKLRYNDDDYFFVSDYNNILLSHPYLQDKDFTYVRDLYDNLIVPPMVEVAREKGDGFTSYWWKKNNSDDTLYEKLTYSKNFKKWSWIIGTGVYIDDIDKEIAIKKSALIARLKNLLRDTKIGQTGYIYIFDENANMIIHPDKTIENKKIDKLINNDRDTYIFDDLVNAYKNGDKKLYYLWDAPNDRGNFSYKKISWIEYDPYFKWYICSSGYLDEFHISSKELKEYMIYTALFISIIIAAISLYFLNNILNPIVKLSQNAKDVIDGNLDSRYNGVINSDEIGLLSTQFNLMLDTMHEQMNTLDMNVKSKTKELTKSLQEKDILLKEIHHRVKNNLFVISGIIGLQTFGDKEISKDELIKSIQQRIQALALAHDMLCKTNNKDSLNIKKYIQKLVEYLNMAYIKDTSSLRCEYEIQEIKLNIDQILSCGLIINELVTNSIKYAFKDKNSYLKISLKEDNNKNIILIIQDNGDTFDESKPKGIGLELVEMSVKQLNGEFNMDTFNGVKIQINFPKEYL